MPIHIPRYAIALDVGGTSVKSGVVRMDTAAVEQRTRTPIESTGSADVILSTLSGIVRHHVERTEPGKILGLGLAFPGPFDYHTGISRIRNLEKYEAIYGVDVGSELRARAVLAGLPVRFRNDAEAAVVGECRYGAGQEFNRVIGVTLGTGFGTAFIDHGEPQLSGPGVPPNGWLHAFPVGNLRADDAFSIRGLQRLLAQAGGLPLDIKQAADAARTGDQRAAAVFSRYGRGVGKFLASFAVAYRADAVLVLGGIAEALNLFGPSLAAMLPVRVLPGSRGSDAAILGAAQLVTPDDDR